MKIINAGVTAPKGFKCAGLRAGVKDRRNIYKEHCKSRSSFMGKEDRRRTRSSQSSGN